MATPSELSHPGGGRLVTTILRLNSKPNPALLSRATPPFYSIGVMPAFLCRINAAFSRGHFYDKSTELQKAHRPLFDITHLFAKCTSKLSEKIRRLFGGLLIGFEQKIGQDRGSRSDFDGKVAVKTGFCVNFEKSENPGYTVNDIFSIRLYRYTVKRVLVTV